MRDLTIDHLRARQVALELAFTEILTPLLVAVDASLALELVKAMRSDMVAKTSTPDEQLAMVGEEAIQALADKIERRVRMKLAR